MDSLRSVAKRLSIVGSKPKTKRSSEAHSPSSSSTRDQGLSIASREISQSKMETSNTPRPSTRSMVELAAIITRETEKLEKHLKESGSPMPGFDVNSPAIFPKLPEDMIKSREEIMRATKELGDLVTGPSENLRWMAWDYNNQLSLHAIYHYQIAKSFPLSETATFAQIATKVNLAEVNVRRFLRHAMTNRIFSEPSPGIVAHTAASAVLATSPAMDDWMWLNLTELWTASSLTLSAIERNPSAIEPTQTGFCLANNTTDTEPLFATLGNSPVKAKRFGGAMAALTGGEGYEVFHLLDGYDWARVDAAHGTVVDVGGSHGFVCVDLAKRYANMKFVVQDLPRTIASAPTLPSPTGERIVFQSHDFHTRQPVKDADVYLYRWIFHNHSDKYAINMLRCLIPGLKKGARVLINDYCLPAPGTANESDERKIRSMDLIMLTLLNAQERSEEEFRALFGEAGEGFRFLGVKRGGGSRMSIVEAVWEGEDYGGES